MNLEVECPKCRLRSSEELLYCRNCRTRLIPRSKYDLDLRDYAYKPDLDAIETVKATGFIPYLLKRFTVADLERRMLSTLSTEALRVQYPSDLDLLVRGCASELCLDSLPEVFVVNDTQPNAFTFGSEDHAYLVLVSNLLRILSTQELIAVIGHEFGHIKSGHMLYHTLAEVLAGGIGVSASLLGLNAISIPLSLTLLSWHRESEVTADRASLLLANDINVLERLLLKFAGSEPMSPDQTKIEERVGMLEAVGELFRTHPIVSNRYKLADEFWKSQEFRRARQKIERRQKLVGALTPVCRFCGKGKQIEDLFCPSCRKSQV
jgi:Zn-dependent protease with chaperone function